MGLNDDERQSADLYARRKFGRRSARPRILEYYLPEGGFRPMQDRMRLTPETADALRERGIMMVRVRAGVFRTSEVSIRRYLGGDSFRFPGLFRMPPELGGGTVVSASAEPGFPQAEEPRAESAEPAPQPPPRFVEARGSIQLHLRDRRVLVLTEPHVWAALGVMAVALVGTVTALTAAARGVEARLSRLEAERRR